MYFNMLMIKQMSLCSDIHVYKATIKFFVRNALNFILVIAAYITDSSINFYIVYIKKYGQVIEWYTYNTHVKKEYEEHVKMKDYQ